MSLKNYMKVLLYQMEQAAEGDAGAAGSLLEYFRKTNPWGILQGDKYQVMDSGPPAASAVPDDEENDGEDF